MKQITMNNFLFFVALALMSCSPSKKANVDPYDYKIIGDWLQVRTVLANRNNHMVGPNSWVFKENSCKILIGNNDEYGYKVSGNQFEFLPLEGHSYVEWQEVLMFGKFDLEITDSTMVLTRRDTLQLFFERDSVFFNRN